MTAKDAIRHCLGSGLNLARMLTEDLSDADLLARPVPNANHIAWQLGHVIVSNSRILNTLTGKPGELPEGFAERYTKETAKVEPPAGFLKKRDYLGLLEAQLGAMMTALERMPDADLDKPNTGPMAAFAPTMGTLFLLAANHAMMHLGQISPVRRKLGKPVVF